MDKINALIAQDMGEKAPLYMVPEISDEYRSDFLSGRMGQPYWGPGRGWRYPMHRNWYSPFGRLNLGKICWSDDECPGTQVCSDEGVCIELKEVDPGTQASDPKYWLTHDRIMSLKREYEEDIGSEIKPMFKSFATWPPWDVLKKPDPGPGYSYFRFFVEKPDPSFFSPGGFWYFFIKTTVDEIKCEKTGDMVPIAQWNEAMVQYCKAGFQISKYLLPIGLVAGLIVVSMVIMKGGKKTDKKKK